MNIKRLFLGASYDLSVKDRFPNIDGFNGIPNTEESYLLLSRYDGDLKEGVIELIDLTNFNVLHTWNPDIDKFNESIKKVDEFKYINRDRNNARSRLIHPKLLLDGGLLFTDVYPLRKIDACSNLIYQIDHDEFHHSIETDIDENIWAPSFMYPQSLPIKKVGRGLRAEGGFSDDAIVKLSPDGRILFEKSVSQIFLDNNMEYLLYSTGDSFFSVDPIHLNDIQPVNYDGEYWKKGDVFLSLRHQSMVLLYRPSTNEVIWKGVGPFFHQHDIDILDNHRISIFNNNSKDTVNGNVVDGYNEVIIYDFKNDTYLSYLKSSFEKYEIRTITEGLSEILDNGDMFIEESNYQRSIYLNSDGTLRWTYVNRAKDGLLYSLGWSRILFTDYDIKVVKRFLENNEVCNE